MRSPLPITGRCHYCNRDVGNRRFCKGTSCQRMYWHCQKHPKENRAKRNRKRDFDYTDHFPTDIQQRIDRIVERARKNGTLGWARLA